MEENEFYRELASKITLPFSMEEVDYVEENADTTWIVLKNGEVYALSVIRCEPEGQN